MHYEINTKTLKSRLSHPFPIFRKTERAFFILFLFFLLFTSFLKKDFGKVAVADLTTTKYLSGYAWSSNIGWISFNGDGPSSKYQVTYDPGNSGLLNGYAWSSNIGWISFGCGQDDGTAGRLCLGVDTFPTGLGTTASGPVLDSDTKKLVGFARACSVFENGCSGQLKNPLFLGGWDGWISLSGKTADDTRGYGVTLDVGTNKFIGFVWGGGQEDSIDGSGRNISPQSPGWINFSGSNSVVGGIGGSGVKLCDTPNCGVLATVGVTCERQPFPIIGTPVKWTATVNPLGNYTYKWTIIPAKKTTDPDSPLLVIGTDYIFSGDESPEMTVNYKIAGVGEWTTDVTVSDASGVIVGGCKSIVKTGVDVTLYTVRDKGFIITPSGAMSTQFIRSIRSVTFPDVQLTLSSFGGFTESVIIEFDKILSPGGTSKSGNGEALIVDPQFWIGNDPPGSTITVSPSGGIYPVINLRLKLTKNQASTDTLPSSDDYKVIIDSEAGGNSTSITLKITNPSGGVKEK